MACAELTERNLTVVLDVKGKPPTAGVCSRKNRPFPGTDSRTVDVGIGLDT